MPCDICGRTTRYRFERYSTNKHRFPEETCGLCLSEVKEEISKVHGIDCEEIEYRRV